MEDMSAHYLDPDQVATLADQHRHDLAQLLTMVQLTFALDVAEICLECVHFRPLRDGHPCACLRRIMGFGTQVCDARIHLPSRAAQLVTECRWKQAEITARERRRKEHEHGSSTARRN